MIIQSASDEGKGLVKYVEKELGARKLTVLTVLHNYYIQRSDRTTAAERFLNRNLGIFSGIY